MMRGGKVNLWKGEWSQFDNQGGTGTIYAYFKLPHKGYYQFRVTALKDVDVPSSRLLTISNNGGSAGGESWHGWFIASGTHWDAGQVRDSLTPGDVFAGATTQYEFISLYQKNEAAFNFMQENFKIEIYEL